MRISLAEVVSVVVAAVAASLLVLHGAGMIQVPLALTVGLGVFLAIVPTVPKVGTYVSERRSFANEIALQLEWTRKFVDHAQLPVKVGAASRNKRSGIATVLLHGNGRLTVRASVISILLPELAHPLNEYLAVYSLALQQSETLEIAMGIEISQYVQSRGLVDLAELEAPMFLSGFYRCIMNPAPRKAVEDVFTSPQSGEIDAALREITRRYFEGPYLRYFQTVLKNEKDLRKILVNLARKGEYLASEVGEEARQRIERDLKALLKGSSPILVLKAEAGGGKKAITEVFQGVPRLGGQGYITGIPGIESRPFGLWIVRPTGHLSVDEFVRDLEYKILRNTEGLPGYQAVIRAYSLTRQKTFPEEIATSGSIDKQYIVKCRSSLAYFDEAERTEDVEALMNRIFIPAEDILLKLLPFNLFFPEGTESERDFLYGSYRRAKKAFGVEKITDWRTRDPAKLADYLVLVGQPSYTDDEALAVYGTHLTTVSPVDIRDRLRTIAQSIVDRSGEYEKSLTL